MQWLLYFIIFFFFLNGGDKHVVWSSLNPALSPHARRFSSYRVWIYLIEPSGRRSFFKHSLTNISTRETRKIQTRNCRMKRNQVCWSKHSIVCYNGFYLYIYIDLYECQCELIAWNNALSYLTVWVYSAKRTLLWFI